MAAVVPSTAGTAVSATGYTSGATCTSCSAGLIPSATINSGIMCTLVATRIGPNKLGHEDSGIFRKELCFCQTH